MKQNTQIEGQIDGYKRVLTDFNRQGIQYCLLRNYEFMYDDSFPAEGLDILVSWPDMPKADLILRELSFTKRKQQFSLAHQAYFKLVDLKRVSFDIQVGGIYWNDLKYLDEKVLQNRVNKEFFYVLSENDAFIMYVVHSILGKRYFKQKYKDILSSLKINKEYALHHLTKIFNKSIAKKIIFEVEQDKFEKIPVYSLVFYFILKKPRHVLTFAKLFGRWIIWKKPFTPAPLISVLGPDGAGKSTLVTSLKEHLKATKRKVAVVYTGRGRNHLLPITKLGRAYKAAEKQKTTSEPANRKPLYQKTQNSEQNFLPFVYTKGLNFLRKFKPFGIFSKTVLYTASAPIFALDQLLRYYAHIFPSRMKKRIVLTDRYGSDIMLMKHVPFRFKKFLLRLFTTPTITIFLYNSPEILNQRRPKEDLEDLRRQLQIFNQFDYSLRMETARGEEDRRQVLEFVETFLLRNWY